MTELIALANERKLKLQKLESSEDGTDKKETKASECVKEIDVESEGIDWGMSE